MTSALFSVRPALALVSALSAESVDLILTDPPYHQITKSRWDNGQTQQQHVAGLLEVFAAALPALAVHGAILVFAGLGKHGAHPVFDLVHGLEALGYTFRNWLTWQKRRAYGKSHDYLYVREEILWFSKSAERTEVRFTIPLTAEKRGYAGFDAKYPAKSEFKRVGNVFAEPELMRPRRETEKPRGLLTRLIETHSLPRDLVVDPYCGTGSTGRACIATGRSFVGGDVDPDCQKFWWADGPAQ